MDVIKLYSRRSLLWIILFISLWCIVINSVFHFGLNIASETRLLLLVVQVNARIPEAKPFIEQLTTMIDILKVWFTPVSTGIFFLSGLFLWFFLYRSVVSVSLAGKTEADESKKEKAETVNMKSTVNKKEKKQNDNRLFLHLLSVFQREGRLMDFFSEDLDDYDDDQIGAAVRTIHDNCKKAVNKYLTSKAVISEEEGEEFTVEPDFDPNAIKLTGNVTGDPPFKGVVRHRGWKTTRLELPTLSSSRDPNIIAPAEIEIL